MFPPRYPAFRVPMFDELMKSQLHDLPPMNAYEARRVIARCPVCFESREIPELFQQMRVLFDKEVRLRWPEEKHFYIIHRDHDNPALSRLDSMLIAIRE